MPTNSIFEKETESLKQSSYLKKTIAGFLDAGIFLSLYVMAGVYFSDLSPYFNSLYILVLVFVLYRALAIFTTGGTFGMTLCNTIYLNGEKRLLSPLEKILAALFILINDIAYYDK